MLAKLHVDDEATKPEACWLGGVQSDMRQCTHLNPVHLTFRVNTRFGCHLLLSQVCPCICFCAYVEEQLQVMHDNAEVITARIVQEQQELEQQIQQPPSSQQQHNQPLSNGNHTQDGTQLWQKPHQQQQHKRASQNGGADGSNGGSSTLRQQRVSDCAALAAVVAAASTKLRVLGRPIAEFSSCRREWVLKLGKAVAMGFMQKAAGAVRVGFVVGVRV